MELLAARWGIMATHHERATEKRVYQYFDPDYNLDDAAARIKAANAVDIIAANRAEMSRMMAPYLTQASLLDLWYITFQVMHSAEGIPCFRDVLADVQTLPVLRENLVFLTNPRVRLSLRKNTLYKIYQSNHRGVIVSLATTVAASAVQHDYPPHPAVWTSENRSAAIIELHELVCSVMDIPIASETTNLSRVEPQLFRVYEELHLDPSRIVGYLNPLIFSADSPEKVAGLAKLYIACRRHHEILNADVPTVAAHENMIKDIAASFGHNANYMRDFFWIMCETYPAFAFEQDSTAFELTRGTVATILPSHIALMRDCIEALQPRQQSTSGINRKAILNEHIFSDSGNAVTRIDFATCLRVAFTNVIKFNEIEPGVASMTAQDALRAALTVPDPIAIQGGNPAIAVAAMMESSRHNDASTDGVADILSGLKFEMDRLRTQAQPIVAPSGGAMTAHMQAKGHPLQRNIEALHVKPNPPVMPPRPQQTPAKPVRRIPQPPVMAQREVLSRSETPVSVQTDHGGVSVDDRSEQPDDSVTADDLLSVLDDFDHNEYDPDASEMGVLHESNVAHDLAKGRKMQADRDASIGSSFGKQGKPQSLVQASNALLAQASTPSLQNPKAVF